MFQYNVRDIQNHAQQVLDNNGKEVTSRISVDGVTSLNYENEALSTIERKVGILISSLMRDAGATGIPEIKATIGRSYKEMVVVTKIRNFTLHLIDERTTKGTPSMADQMHRLMRDMMDALSAAGLIADNNRNRENEIWVRDINAKHDNIAPQDVMNALRRFAGQYRMWQAPEGYYVTLQPTTKAAPEAEGRSRDLNDITQRLKRLGFQVEQVQPDTLHVTQPSQRVPGNNLQLGVNSVSNHIPWNYEVTYKPLPNGVIQIKLIPEAPAGKATEGSKDVTPQQAQRNIIRNAKHQLEAEGYTVTQTAYDRLIIDNTDYRGEPINSSHIRSELVSFNNITIEDVKDKIRVIAAMPTKATETKAAGQIADRDDLEKRLKAAGLDPEYSAYPNARDIHVSENYAVPWEVDAMKAKIRTALSPATNYQMSAVYHISTGHWITVMLKPGAKAAKKREPQVGDRVTVSGTPGQLVEIAPGRSGQILYTVRREHDGKELIVSFPPTVIAGNAPAKGAETEVKAAAYKLTMTAQETYRKLKSAGFEVSQLGRDLFLVTLTNRKLEAREVLQALNWPENVQAYNDSRGVLVKQFPAQAGYAPQPKEYSQEEINKIERERRASSAKATETKGGWMPPARVRHLIANLGEDMVSKGVGFVVIQSSRYTAADILEILGYPTNVSAQDQGNGRIRVDMRDDDVKTAAFAPGEDIRVKTRRALEASGARVTQLRNALAVTHPQRELDAADVEEMLGGLAGSWRIEEQVGGVHLYPETSGKNVVTAQDIAHALDDAALYYERQKSTKGITFMVDAPEMEDVLRALPLASNVAVKRTDDGFIVEVE